LRKFAAQVEAASLDSYIRVAYVNCSDYTHVKHHGAKIAAARRAAEMAGKDAFARSGTDFKGKDMHLKHRAVKDLMHMGSVCEAHDVVTYPTARFYREKTRTNAFNFIGPQKAGFMLSAALRVMGPKFSHTSATGSAKHEQDEVAKRVVALQDRGRAIWPIVANASTLSRNLYKGGFGPAKLDTGDGPLETARAKAQAKEEHTAAQITELVQEFDEAVEMMKGAKDFPAIVSLIDSPTSGGLTMRYEELEAGADGKEGCEISGQLEVARVPTSLRLTALAVGATIEPMQINISHTVTHFGFGDSEGHFNGENDEKRSGEDDDERDKDDDDDDDEIGDDLEEMQAKLDKIHTMMNRLDKTDDTAQSKALAEHAKLLRQRIEMRRLRPVAVRREKLIRKLGELAKRDDTDFGEIGLNLAPLDGTEHSSKAMFSDWTHYIKVVPTSFNFISGDIGEAYLYSANNRMNIRQGEQPRAVFTFDVSALRLKVTEHRTSTASFLTHTVAVIGGLFTTAGLLDGLLWNTGQAIMKKTL